MPQPRDWRDLVRELVPLHWPGLDPRWIDAQVRTESGGDPRARSTAGAVGLLQLMPATAAELGVEDPLDPEQNLDGGLRYLREQYRQLGEIPEDPDRLFWAFAAYNAGRGYVNRALALARATGLTDWWRWGTGSLYLADPRCQVRGRRPDVAQVWKYVAAIRRDYYARAAAAQEG